MTAGPTAARTGVELGPDPSRVLARLFLPGEEPDAVRSRVGEVVARVMALEEPEVERLVDRLLADFGPRHRGYEQLLINHASVVTSHVAPECDLSAARRLLVGAAFTAEVSVESAAVCNPSAVLHPDQSGLDAGQARLALSIRGIGEHHLSSIGFRSAVVGPGPRWAFAPPRVPVTSGEAVPGRWDRAHLEAVLAEGGEIDELGLGVLRSLPSRFTEPDLERALTEIHPQLATRPGATELVQELRRLVGSVHTVVFDADSALEERVLMPRAAEESNGMEDARFTRFVEDDATVDYRATYTAYDGRQIAPRLLTSPDLRVFRTHRLIGPAARNKGMALFPRRVGGRYLALCRSDGESVSLASSADGFSWSGEQVVHRPTAVWEALQVGNCGAPIETPAGWLVLTHGVGPMRIYSLGAILLDLDDPSIVLGRLTQPLLEPADDERDGYVPNVVYSCGGVTHDDVLWLPFGINDTRIGVAYTRLADVLAGLA